MMTPTLTRAAKLRVTREENVKLRLNARRPERYVEVVRAAVDKRKLLERT